MSTRDKKLSNAEIRQAFSEGSTPVVPQVLTTEEAAALLRLRPKTLNAWKNAGLLEGSYRQRQGQDRYWRDRLLACYFNGADWDDKQKETKKQKSKN